MNNNTWYDKRDIRTDSCQHVNDGYKSAVVHLVVTEPVADYRVQLMVCFSLLMLARWCRSIVVYMEDTECLLPGRAGSLRAALSQEARDADPECQLSFDAVRSEASITLFIGAPEPGWMEDYISISCRGWMANIGFNRPCNQTTDQDQCSFFGATFAACLGNAELFRYVIGQRSRPYRKWHSLWTNKVYDAPENAGYGVPTAAVNLGRVHLVGCGSIGSSFTYLIPFVSAVGQWVFIDPDAVEGQNTSSSLLFTRSDADNGRSKAALCGDYLTRFGLTAEKFEDDYNKFPYSFNPKDVNTADIIFCFANENNIWSTIQNLYPPICFHATTSKSWGVHIGRHIPLIENCLMCTFKDVAPVAFVAKCAEGDLPPMPELSNPESTHTAILPFLAPAAALVTMAELVKTMAPVSLRLENTIEFNFSSSQGMFIGTYQSFGSCHVCSNQHKLYEQFGPLGQYWPLSIGSTEHSSKDRI